MKRNIFIYSTFILVLITMIGSFSSCKSDDDNPTYLEAFGPSPALRGGELRFLGRNLNNVSEIVLPGNMTITDIQRVSNNEIKIIIPQNATSGYVVLKASDGDITTKTELTFSEPISIEKFYKEGSEGVTSVKAGDRLVFKGDYLNLIKEVVFTDNVVVSLEREEGESYSRDSLSVIVPVGAQTGKVALSNGAEIPILVYTETELTVANATVTTLSPATVKAGKELVIKGENLQLVKAVKFAPDHEVVLPVAEDPYAAVTELKIVVPADSHDGQVILLTHSGLEVEAGAITMAVPTISTLSPATVRGGKVLTIKGTNLDLVTNITFPHVEDAVEPKAKSETELTVDVPLEAGDGKLLLNTASAKSVEKTITTVKSKITSIAPTSLVAGETLTVKGTDLDLVKTVSFGGGQSAAVSNPTATSFTVVVPTLATSGAITLHLASGATVTSTQSLSVTPSTNPTITSMPSKARPGDEITLNGLNLNTVETVYIGSSKVTSYVSRSATSITLIVPSKVSLGIQTVKMINYEDQEFIATQKLDISGREPIVDPLLVWADFQDEGWSIWGKVGEFVTENGSRYYRGTSSGDLIGSWLWATNTRDIPACPNITDYVVKADMKITHDFKPGDYAIQMCINGVWGWCTSGFFPMAADGVTATTGGDWVTVTWTFETLGIKFAPAGGKSDTGLYINKSLFDWNGIALNNLRYQKK